MLLIERFFPLDLKIFALGSVNETVNIYFSSPNVVFKVKLPSNCLVKLVKLAEQLHCYLVLSSKSTQQDTLVARTFVKTMLNRIYFQNYAGLKTIGIGYKFVVSKKNNYIFIIAGLSHLLVHRMDYHTKVYCVKKKKRLVILHSLRPDLLPLECNFIRDLRPPDLYCGKGLRLFHELYKLKEGKKQIR